eukprot:CAMPEP_0175525870 /NCGR_PEP_ID=MMETSP0096-20121207/19328_1 /TAXON_ID=311494 /ORGANISM="Alexandrium monilatum, Strain CCMP3105" /LENGTH=64 /DNA_ID=CAMNT_0016828493 /DNA_START=68 /DNA_END=258 /DNA_ORIENTATION=-
MGHQVRGYRPQASAHGVRGDGGEGRDPDGRGTRRSEPETHAEDGADDLHNGVVDEHRARIRHQL